MDMKVPSDLLQCDKLRKLLLLAGFDLTPAFPQFRFDKRKTDLGKNFLSLSP